VFALLSDARCGKPPAIRQSAKRVRLILRDPADRAPSRFTKYAPVWPQLPTGNRRARSAGGRAMDGENEVRSPKSSLPTSEGASWLSSHSERLDEARLRAATGTSSRSKAASGRCNRCARAWLAGRIELAVRHRSKHNLAPRRCEQSQLHLHVAPERIRGSA
jgi:hypothetical protein